MGFSPSEISAVSLLTCTSVGGQAMRNNILEVQIKNILTKAYQDNKMVNRWGIRCKEFDASEEGIAALITIDEAEIGAWDYAVGDLAYIKQLLEDFTTNDYLEIKDDFQYISMYDKWGPCRCSSEDKAWIVGIKIKTSKALTLFKEAIALLQPTEFEEKLKRLFNRTFEFKEPYEGVKGKYPAEIFREGGELIQIIDLLEELNLTDDIIVDDCELDNGMVQIILKTELTVEKFKKAIDEKLAFKSAKLPQSMKSTKEPHAFFKPIEHDSLKEDFSQVEKWLEESLGQKPSLIYRDSIGHLTMRYEKSINQTFADILFKSHHIFVLITEHFLSLNNENEAKFLEVIKGPTPTL